MLCFIDNNNFLVVWTINIITDNAKLYLLKQKQRMVNMLYTWLYKLLEIKLKNKVKIYIRNLLIYLPYFCRMGDYVKNK